MDSSAEGRKKRDPTKMIQAIIIAAIVLAAAVIVYAAYSNSRVAKTETTAVVASGDSVSLNYIGRLSDGRVFDTSFYPVATDDVAYPKSLTFTLRSNDSYKAFDMTAGNYGSGGTVKGFALGVIGIHVNETRIVEVTADEGYPLNPAMLETKSLVEQIPATENMTDAAFLDNFGVKATVLLVIPHYFWGWNVMVIDDSSGIVTIKHRPEVGQIYYPYGNPGSSTSPEGWPVRVESFDPEGLGGQGVTTVRNLIEQKDVYNIKGVDSDGKTFILWDFSSANSTFVIHKSDSSKGYNAEISGRTLFFEITIVSVTPQS